MSEPQEHVSDVSDLATKREGEFLDAAITEARRTTGPKPTGLCLNCGEELAPPEVIDAIRLGLSDGEGVPRWCPGPECRDEWQDLQRMKKINGR